MDRLRQLIREAHRRSLWQVLSVYLVASWVALQVVEIITESAGLPDWAQPFALMLLIIGLPIVLATAVVQEGVSGAPRESVPGAAGVEDSLEEATPQAAAEVGEEASAGVRHRLFTWRNAIAGGVAAFALLGILVAGYFVLWSTGIGPVGSLAAQGVFTEGDAVVLAQFENTSDDESLGEMVTEALRVDLSGSSIMTLVEPSRIQDALGRMGRRPDETLDADLAQEVAIRDGFKAVISGTVGSAGTGYLFVATMQGAESGQVLATFRESAKSPDDVIDAIDKLSQDIREKAGESLRAIKAEEPLENVTTSSLEALRKYAEAERLSDQGQYARAITALEEAIELDPTFAMAYRKLAVDLNNYGGSLAHQVEAATRAYELRDRLTERERYLAIAYYHNLATADIDAEIRAYETVLSKHPDDQAALNNIALVLVRRTRLEEALVYLERALNGPGASAPASTNYPVYLAMAGRPEEAEVAMQRHEERYPGRALWKAFMGFNLAAFRPDAQAALRAGEYLRTLPEAQGAWRAASLTAEVVGRVQMGHVDEAREALDEGLRDLKALGIWDWVQNMEGERVLIEVMTDSGHDEGMGSSIRQNLDMAFDSLPPEARRYPGAVFTMAVLGDEEGVESFLQRWRDDDIPSSTSPLFDETRQYAEAVLLSRTDPEGALDALNEQARFFGCPGCAIWERGVLAQETGRQREAVDHFTQALTTATENYVADPIMRVLAHERLGQSYEALGDSAKAAEHYGTFAEFWADADPELQPRVQAARSKAAALSGESNGQSPAPDQDKEGS
jgi:tetratricopeptide (TPR) repeat protein